MPGFDGTGPLGYGPMTGGGRGYCVTYLGPYDSRAWVGWGIGRRRAFFGGGGRGWFGRGGGRGWRNWYYATGLPGWARAQYAYPYPFMSPWGY